MKEIKPQKKNFLLNQYVNNNNGNNNNKRKRKGTGQTISSGYFAITITI